MAEIASITSNSSNNQVEQLVQAFRASEQPKIDSIKTKKTTLENTQVFYNNLFTKINSLVSVLDKFGDYKFNNGSPIFNKTDSIDKLFKAKAIKSSKTDVLTATANSEAIPSTISLKVERLASNDVLITKKLTLANNFGLSEGTYNLNFTVNGETKSISLTLTGGETNEDVMKKIVETINKTENIKINASYIKDTSTTGRLTLTSKNSGTDNAITFTGDNTLLSALGLDSVVQNSSSRSIANDNDAGFVTSNAADLNSKIVMNSLNIYRNSNTIDDVIPGVTLNLLKPQEANDQPVVLTTQVDTNGVKDLINNVLTALNDIVDFINSNKQIARSESSVSQLKFNIRSLASAKIDSITDENSPKYLSDLGIKIDENGKFTLSDTTTLEKYLKDDPLKVANIFTKEDGIIRKINDFIYNLQGTEGLISQKKSSLTKQIKNYDDKIKETQSRIDTQAENLRKQYTTLMKTYYEALNQYNSYSSFSSSGLSTSSNLLI